MLANEWQKTLSQSEYILLLAQAFKVADDI